MHSKRVTSVSKVGHRRISIYLLYRNESRDFLEEEVLLFLSAYQQEE